LQDAVQRQLRGDRDPGIQERAQPALDRVGGRHAAEPTPEDEVWGTRNAVSDTSDFVHSAVGHIGLVSGVRDSRLCRAVAEPDAPDQAMGAALRSAHPFDIEAVKDRLAAGSGGYEVVHASPGLEVGVYVLVAPEPDRQQPHADDEIYIVIQGTGT